MAKKELENYFREVTEAAKQTETTSSDYAQYAAIDPSKIPGKSLRILESLCVLL